MLADAIRRFRANNSLLQNNPARMQSTSLPDFVRSLEFLFSGRCTVISRAAQLKWSSSAQVFNFFGRPAYLFSPFYNARRGYADVLLSARAKDGRATLFLHRAGNPAIFYELEYDREEHLFYFQHESEGKTLRVYLAAVPKTRSIQVRGTTFIFNESIHELAPLLLAFDETGNFVKAFHDEYRALAGTPRPVMRGGKAVAWLMAEKIGPTAIKEITGTIEDWPLHRAGKLVKFNFGGRVYAFAREQVESKESPTLDKVTFTVERGFVTEVRGNGKTIFPILVRDARWEIVSSSFKNLPEATYERYPVAIEGIRTVVPASRGVECLHLQNHNSPLPKGDPRKARRQVSAIIDEGPTIGRWISAPRFPVPQFKGAEQMIKELTKARRAFEKNHDLDQAERFVRMFDEVQAALPSRDLTSFRLTLVKALVQLRKEGKILFKK